MGRNVALSFIAATTAVFILIRNDTTLFRRNRTCGTVVWLLEERGLNWLILCSSSASSRFRDDCGTEPKATLKMPESATSVDIQSDV